MFTGLKAMTHFGRPQFEPFLNSLQTMHSDVSAKYSFTVFYVFLLIFFWTIGTVPRFVKYFESCLARNVTHRDNMKNVPLPGHGRILI